MGLLGRGRPARRWCGREGSAPAGLVVLAILTALSPFALVPATAAADSQLPISFKGKEVTFDHVGDYYLCYPVYNGNCTGWNETVTQVDDHLDFKDVSLQQQTNNPNQYNGGAWPVTLTGSEHHDQIYNDTNGVKHECQWDATLSADPSHYPTGQLTVQAGANPPAASLSIGEDALVNATNVIGDCGSYDGLQLGPEPTESEVVIAQGAYDAAAQTITLNTPTWAHDPPSIGSNTTSAGSGFSVSGTLTGDCKSETNAVPPGGGGFMRVTGRFMEADTKWESCGDTVRVDGIDVVPKDSSVHVVIDSAAGTVTSTGPVTLPVGESAEPLFSGTLNQPLSATWEFPLTPDEKFLGLPIVKTAQAGGTFRIALSDGSAQLQLFTGFYYFPDQVGGDIGSIIHQWSNLMQVTVNWDQSDGLVGARAEVNKLLLGPLSAAANWKFLLNEVALDWKWTGHDVWTAEVKIGSIPNDKFANLFGVVAGGSSQTGTFTITDGLWTGTSFNFQFGTPIPLGTIGVSLRALGAAIQAQPDFDGFELSGTVGLIAGPSVKVLGTTLYAIGLNGRVSGGWGRDCDLSGEATVDSDSAFFTASGDAGIYNTLKLVSGSFCWGKSTVSFLGQELPELGSLSQLMPAPAQIQGFIHGTDQFDATAGVTLSLRLFGVSAVASGRLTATNTGMSVCGQLTEALLGQKWAEGQVLVTYNWGDQLPRVYLGCDRVPVRTGGPARDARAAAAATRFSLPQRARNVTVAVRGGKSGAAVTLHGPHGTTIRVPAGLKHAIANGQWLAYAYGGTTYVVLRAPAAGPWTAGGGQVNVSEQIPPASISGKVSKRKGKFTLTYKALGLAGRKLELIDQGTSSEIVLGTTSRRTGRITLTPTPHSGPHRILAEVLAGGLALPRRQIATYKP